MIWVAIAVLALIAMAPLGWSVWRPAALRGRRDAALDLHRAQLAEIDRDLEQGRIAAPEHATAQLEVQRRLLTEAAREDAGSRSSLGPLLVVLGFVPIAGVLLYLPGSAPGLRAMPLAQRIARSRAEQTQAHDLAERLKARIATLDPTSDQAREGYLLLGNLEDGSGNLPAAADAWARALAIRFDPTIAAQVAEARSRIEGSVSADSAALFRRALAEAPPDAPWRAVAEQRLTTAR